MSYRELAPSGFPDVVVCRWEQRVPAGAGDHRQRVIPDGCADILVYGDGRAVVVGPTARASTPELAAGTHVRGLRFRAEAIGPVLKVPGAELRDAEIPLDAVVPAGAVAEVTDAVWSGRYPAALQSGPIDDRVRYAIHALGRAGGAGLAALAERTGLSERHLRRLVVEHSGLEPRAIRRVARLQRLLRCADRGAGEGLAMLASQAGYADQAHMTRDVRELTGTTPLLLFRERGLIAR